MWLYLRAHLQLLLVPGDDLKIAPQIGMGDIDADLRRHRRTMSIDNSRELLEVHPHKAMMDGNRKGGVEHKREVHTQIKTARECGRNVVRLLIAHTVD